VDRKKFLKNGLMGMGAIVAIPTLIASCSNSNTEIPSDTETGDCNLSPRETAGPFPIKTPSNLVRENIIGDRSGIALLMTLTVQDQSNNCEPISNVFVDLWHCDANGEYSEYGGTGMQSADHTNAHFLRGRQTTNVNGQASFISIFPGWYNGRAPHIHIEIKDSSGNSLRVIQIAFPKDVCDTVYATNNYNGEANTLNESDNVFSDSLDGNMLDSITGNTDDGYTLLKTIIV
tara:strand:- start:37354 stop:38049 length:696 start_codon:yes stop_codon:yes gene_type:complete